MTCTLPPLQLLALQAATDAIPALRLAHVTAGPVTPLSAADTIMGGARFAPLGSFGRRVSVERIGARVGGNS